MVAYLLLVSSQQSSAYSTGEKKFKGPFVYTPTDSTYLRLLQRQPSNYDLTKKTSDEAKELTQAALQNKNFRQALNFFR